jgi:hypothetical protein
MGCAGLSDEELTGTSDLAVDESVLGAAEETAGEIEIIDKVPSLQDYPGIADACHGDVTCSGVTSCTNWSSSFDCDGGDCLVTNRCCEEPFAKGTDVGSLMCEFGPGPGFFQNRERFRVCFYVDSSQCMEFDQFQSFAFCGC